LYIYCIFFFQAEDGIRDRNVTGVQTCALPIFGKMAAWIIGILITTTMIATIKGIGSASLFHLNADQFDVGQAEMEQGDVLEDTLDEVESESTPDRIISFIPSNIFLDMTGDRPTSIIAVVIFSMIVGIAVLGLRRKEPEKAETFTK